MPVSNIEPPVTVASAALVFDAPITQLEPEINITRNDRGLAAFAGFQETTISTYDIFSFDRQSSDRGDRFVRDSYSEQVGTTRR